MQSAGNIRSEDERETETGKQKEVKKEKPRRRQRETTRKKGRESKDTYEITSVVMHGFTLLRAVLTSSGVLC